ncbi:MAG: acyl-CoA dehydrogenase family protein, partial [Deltaproteobacteria bacterium]|nr:acyl-CoA dehydrogenase family protein [Deltaproteobacteria bacterium]
SGGNYLDLIVLLEEMGYNILPGPFFSTMVLGAIPILQAGTDAQKRAYLPAIAAGEKIFTMALTEPIGKYDAASVSVKAEAAGDGYVINGTKLFIPDANVADFILCVARTKEGPNPEEGITIFIVDAKTPGIKITLLQTLACDKQTEVVFDNVKVGKDSILGGLDRGWAVVKDVLQKAAVAKAAELVGHSQAALEMAVSYAKERIQFGRPIGSFQAIQHYCANMLTDVDGARYITYEAAWMISEGLEAAKLAAMAKAWVGDAARRVTLLAHQIFGAVGFTMELDLHLYYRRALAGSQAFGDSDYQREIVAQAIGL